MLFTTPAEYALRALTYLAAKSDGRPVQVKDIAEAEGIPRHYLAKILNQLAGRGLVRATRGPGGGFLLTRPAEEISAVDVLESIEGMDSIRRRCVLGLDECSDDQPCAIHDSWTRYREVFLREVSRASLAAMARTLVQKRSLPSSSTPPEE
jgi:Rrf2 family protein